MAILDSAALAATRSPHEPASGNVVDAPQNCVVAGDDSESLFPPQLIRRFAPGELDSEDPTAAIRRLLDLDDDA